MAVRPPHDQPGKFEPVVPRNVSDEVARQMRELIAAGELRHGERLPSERELAERLGVGRPAVREALRELRAQGLITPGRGRQGTHVSAHASETERSEGSVVPAASTQTNLTMAERIAHLMELRTAIETQAAVLAVRRADLTHLQALAAAIPDGDDLSAVDDARFHRALAAASRNPLLQAAVEELVERLHERASGDLPSLYGQPYRVLIRAQHLAIVEAVRSGDEEIARRAVRNHLDYVARILRRLLGVAADIRMIVCDLDGTLLAGPRLVTERTRAAVIAARDSGVLMVLASARPPRSMRVYHHLLGLTTPVIAGNGALLWDLESSVPIYREALEGSLAGEMVEFGRSLGAVVNVESDDEWFAESMNERIMRNIEVYGVEPPHSVGAVDGLLFTGEPIDKVFLDLRDLAPAAADAARGSITREFGGRANITETAQGLVDLVSLRASKAVMAQRLARSRGIEADRVAAIGDHDNDVALLRWAGVGVAMGNATAAAKAAADIVTASNLRDGAAEAIESWILPG
ncbi:MAG: Cof-type HAD-IIB family hydrolase [Thermoleophilia bacterium]